MLKVEFVESEDEYDSDKNVKIINASITQQMKERKYLQNNKILSNSKS